MEQSSESSESSEYEPKKSRMSESIERENSSEVQNSSLDFGLDRLSAAQQAAIIANKHKLQDIIYKLENLRNYVDTNSVTKSLEIVGNLIKKMNEGYAPTPTTLEIWDPVNCTMESHALHLAHELFTSAADRINAGLFSDSGYIAAISSAVGKRDGNSDFMDWSIIAADACLIANTTRFTQSMYGTFDIDKIYEQPEKVQRERGRRRVNAIQTMAKKITQPDAEEERQMRTREIHNQIEEIYKKNNNQPIPYFPLILDPTSFMYTVDNAFQLSLLLRDNLIVMDMDSRCKNVPTPSVRPATNYERFTVSKKREAESIIISMSPSQYRELISLHKIKVPLLNPQRKNVIEISNKMKALSISNLPKNIQSNVMPKDRDD